MSVITSLFKSPSVGSAPKTPSRSDADIQAAALAERKRRAAATGRSSTILSGPLGAPDSQNIQRKTLLGE